METSFDSIVEKYNEKNEFITKIWVWIAIISVFGIIIISQKTKPIDKIPLAEIGKIEQINFPLIDIPVPSNYFALIYVLLLTGLIIRWVESFRRSASYRQNIIEPLIKEFPNLTISNQNKSNYQINSRLLLDGMVYSTTTSVWGIVPDFKENNVKTLYKFLRGFVYISLKIVVFLTHFLLPLLAMSIVVFNSLNSKTPTVIWVIVLIFFIIANYIILTAAYSEWQYSSNPMRKQIMIKQVLKTQSNNHSDSKNN